MEAKRGGNEIVVVNTGNTRKCWIVYLVMDQSNRLTEILTTTLAELEPIYEQEKPDIGFVHGDTSATLAGSIATSHHKIPLTFTTS